jgi:recombination protein RecR
MNNELNALDQLIVLFSKLPGIGRKSASRLACHILDTDPEYARKLAAQIASLHQRIRHCSICGGFTENDPCPICTDTGRDRTLLCVVERAQDIRVIEDSREFHGRFHVLGGLIAPLEGISPDKLSIGSLVNRVRSEGIAEIILALNPTVEGDTTALYIQKVLQDTTIPISRLASGLPVGGDLEYTDRLTLSRSFRGRVRL